MASVVEKQICEGIYAAFEEVFGEKLEEGKVALQPTRKDFEGTYTFVTFPFLKISKKKPEETGELIGQFLQEKVSVVTGFNVVKGFLNFVIADAFWAGELKKISSDTDFGKLPSKGEKVMVEYSSPNTNKPLHLGHLRNNFLGFSVARIMEACGYDVLKTNLVNDRGIHICKSMLAYQKFGNGETPTADLKGDKLVGNYYVKYDQEYKKEISELLEKLKAENAEAEEKALKDRAEKEAPLMLEAKEMLRKWEEGDTETVALWKKMNGWVYDGFNATYTAMGVSFDKIYQESETYLLGKEVVEEGLGKGVFYRRDDGSVWVDLTPDGLDEKLLLRSDGTSVYMTQDMGTADLKFKDFPMQQSVYVVGNEQDYHFKVLKLIMQKLGRSYADGIFHLSYGMVDLPSGKMKSREGTVVDADDLIADMTATAKERTEVLGKIDDFSSEEAQKLYSMLALGALKYYLLKVDPKKRMLFNPEESIDFQGNTGVYIQYTHAKIRAIIRKAELDGIDYKELDTAQLTELHPLESEVISMITNYPQKVAEAGEHYAPSVVANYVYDLAKTYSRFYAELSIFGEEDVAKKSLRVLLSEQVSSIIAKGMFLLGVDVPEKM
ncbi:arginine--tRNA ligase [Flammeovirgaceae bacterium SG7u.111]|nr:arginine--tRNA ligase [Flammeovirgaceae bacterium SG7u.132]WPO38540.1 arginine--tRNA ligase [Flammeovirgaceae bacterium SG7u.111]